MRKTLTIAVSLLVLITAGLLYAGEDKKMVVAKDAITGKIVAVEMDKHSLTFRNATTGQETVYIFNDSTKFYRDGKVVELKTIVPDEDVVLKLSPDDETLIVRLDTPVVMMKDKDHDDDDDK